MTALAPLAHASSGGTLFVNASTGSDTGTCRLHAHPCQTISYALTQATSGVTIQVAAGDYQAAYRQRRQLRWSRRDIFQFGRHRDGGGRVTLRIFDLKKPVIAAINGPAVGFGITMTLAMDVRLASSAARIGFVFSRRGVVPEACSTWFLPRIVGIAQAAALIPGVSRSGSTITVGLFEDFNREEIARFSFLMSTPIIFGAGLLKLPKMLHEMHGGQGPVTWGGLAAGFVAAAVVGTAVIRWMLAWLRTRTAS